MDGVSGERWWGWCVGSGEVVIQHKLQILKILNQIKLVPPGNGSTLPSEQFHFHLVMLDFHYHRRLQT